MASKTNLKKRKYPSIEVRNFNGQIIFSLDSSQEVAGKFPHEMEYDEDNGIVDIYDEDRNFLGKVKFPEGDFFVFFQGNSEA